MTEISELELSDDQLQGIHGGCATSGVSLGGLHLGFGGFHLGGGFHYGGGFGFGGPVIVSQPVTAVQLVPVQTQTVVAEPVAQAVGVTGVQATTCQQGVALALV